jgi:hypothetical protein
MTPRLMKKAGVGLAIAVAMLFTMSSVASATVHTYNVTLTRGTIRVGTTAFVTPGTTPSVCPGTTAITGTINDAAATDNITGNLNIQSGDFAAPFTTGRFRLTATGTATGTNAGNYNATTHTFTGLTFPTITFSVRSITHNATTSVCTLGAVVCSGTASLTLSGGIVPPATSLPLTSSQEIYVNSTAGHITSTSGCGFPWGLVVFTSASLSIGPNNPPGTDPGAIFHQV